MLSHAAYSYLMRIYDMCENGEKITPKSLADRMQVKRPTAYEFIKKMEDEGFVIKRDRDYCLTESGYREARRIMRHHRIIETLLYRTGVDIERACALATEMQSIIDDESVECICKYLGNPHECPHGRPIPEVV